MKMAGLETKVREALIKRSADELVKYASEHPEYKAMTNELIETMANSIIDSMASTLGDVDEEEKTEMRQELQTKVLPQIKAQFDGPDQLRKTMYEQMKSRFISVRQLKAQLRSHLSDLRESEEVSEDVIANYEKSYERLFEFVRTNDSIVKRLAKVAETEGIDKATQKETRYAIIRELFPTPDEYRAFEQKSMETPKHFTQQAQSALMADGEMGQALSGMLGVMGKVMGRAQEMTKKIHGNYLEKRIQEIYG